MALLQLPQTRSDGINHIDYRTLYYSKYQYRARVYANGIYLCNFRSTREEFEKTLKKHKKHSSDVNIDMLVKFAQWKNKQKIDKKGQFTIRIENNIASIFSNDLYFLKELQSIGLNVDYTAIEDVVPVGKKYFVNEPKFKHRIYLKSKRVSDEFPEKLQAMFDRYSGTGTQISPSVALRNWTSSHDAFPSMISSYYSNSWRSRYCSSHFFIDYNDESFITLFALMFDGMISKKYALLKQPEST